MLRMTKQADYGIVLMTHLACHQGRLFAAPELAEVTQLPLPTVSKILKLLGRGGLLDSHRGAKGGYSLARAPEDSTVQELNGGAAPTYDDLGRWPEDVTGSSLPGIRNWSETTVPMEWGFSVATKRPPSLMLRANSLKKSSTV